jgi:hypothetical protein
MKTTVRMPATAVTPYTAGRLLTTWVLATAGEPASAGVSARAVTPYTAGRLLTSWVPATAGEPATSGVPAKSWTSGAGGTQQHPGRMQRQ